MLRVLVIIIIIIHEFHRDASLEQNFRAADHHIPSTTSLELKNIWKWACEFSKSQV